MSEQLGINLTLLSDIENNRKHPFSAEKIELFCELMNLSSDEKAEMLLIDYDKLDWYDKPILYVYIII